MKISKREMLPNGWQKFNLNVGGFCIRGCRWHPATRRIFFPFRYGKRRARYKVVFAHGVLVKRLRELLESGELETPRDRRPCVLKIHGFGRSRSEEGWLVFSFTVRGFTILGCRWLPQRGSIQLPVTFNFDEAKVRHVKKRVVCAYGSHMVRLRNALAAELAKRDEESPAYEAKLAPVVVA
jgi:hypothetical protein